MTVSRSTSLHSEINQVEYSSNFPELCSVCSHEVIPHSNQAYFIKNGLKFNLDFWKNELRANSFILSIIEQGYKIPFDSEPSSCFAKNNRSARDHSAFVDSALSDLLQNDFAMEVKQKPFCVNPLSVSVNSSGKERLILDLRHVNKHIHKFKVKFEGHCQALDFCKQGNMMFKFDLKSGYYHVNINEQFQKYLGFSWFYEGKIRFFVYKVLAFGLASAPYVFTKLLRPLVKYWRSAGIHIIVYLDDGWGIESVRLCKSVSDRVRLDLARAGFVVNNEKSIWEPCLIMDWLGFVWNMETGSVELSSVKFDKLKTLIYEVLFLHKRCTARLLARIVGKIISMSFSLGNICYIMTRNMQVSIAQREFWDTEISVLPGVLAELQFWLDNLNKLPFRAITPVLRQPERIMFVDASDRAGAGVLLCSENKVSHCMFSESEIKSSSTFRELRALNHALLSFRPVLTGKLVKVYTDNQNIVRIVNCGSTKVVLQELAKRIFDTAIEGQFTLEVAWIPRELNVEADSFSKTFDWDDWGISDHVFQFFNNKWGPYQVDRFADASNKKVDVFYSRFWSPGTSGVDAFAFDWGNVNNWIVPPVCLIPRVIKHLIRCRAIGTLIVPKWPSSLFWPLLVSFGKNSFQDFIREYVEYSKPRNFFVPGSCKDSVFAMSPFCSNVLALRINCNDLGQ